MKRTLVDRFEDVETTLILEALRDLMARKSEAFKAVQDNMPAAHFTELDFAIPQLKSLIERFEEIE